MPSASPVGTPKHSLRKMTSTEDPKGTHSEGLFVMPPVGMSLGSLKSEFGPSTSTKQQGQQATPSVGQVSSSPGKRGDGLHDEGGEICETVAGASVGRHPVHTDADILATVLACPQL